LACLNICSALLDLSNAAQTFKRMMDHTKDGLEGVFAYMDDSRVSSPDRQTHLRHLLAFFTALASNGLAIIWKNVCLQHLLLRFLVTQFRRQEHGRSCRQNQKLPTPSGYQAAAMFSWHGKFLPPFFAQVCTIFETFN
jgi:hypothetical protein